MLIEHKNKEVQFRFIQVNSITISSISNIMIIIVVITNIK